MPSYEDLNFSSLSVSEMNDSAAEKATFDPNSVKLAVRSSIAGMQRPPREGFQAVVKHVKEGIEEFNIVTIFLEKRIELEWAYYRNLEEFFHVMPSKVIDTEVLWQGVKSTMKQTLASKKTYLEVGSKIVAELQKDLVFQKAVLDKIASDVIESFDEYSKKLEELRVIKEEYMKRSQVDPHDFNNDPDSDTATIESGSSGKTNSEGAITYSLQFLPCEEEYRKIAGSLARRRTIQVNLVNNAFKRFIELQYIRLERIKKAFGTLQHIQVQTDRELGRTSASILTDIKEFPIVKHVLRYGSDWNDIMTLPDHIVFHDKENGRLKDITFGVDLVDHLCAIEKEIPNILAMAVKELGYRGMDTKNLYALKVDAEKLKKICDLYEKDASKFKWDQISDVGLIVGMIKRYFYALPEPLFPYTVHAALHGISRRQREDDRCQLITRVIGAMPAEHLTTLKFIIDHLAEVLQKSFRNKMSVETLANEMAPCLIRPRDNQDIEFAQVIIMDLIRNCSLLLGNLPIQR
jgi:hypothetical protein